MTTIKPCDCTSKYQDQKYGRGNRVHNQTKQSVPVVERKWRCTICMKEKTN